MAYEKQTWIDGKSPLDAARMNHIEDGLDAAHKELKSLNEEIANQPTSKPRVYIDGVIPTTKDDVLAEMRFENGLQSWHAYLKIKCQGRSSMEYPKKNFTVKLYKDEARTVKMPVTFGLFGQASDKYVLKANWTDHTHARNVGVARLTGQIIGSQPGYDDLPAELRNSPNNGAINGFPVLVYTNGTYQGIYMWNIGKDPWMWGMDEDNPNHALISGNFNTTGTNETVSACNFRMLWDGTDAHWKFEIGENKDAIVESFNRVISCVKDTTDIDFKRLIGTYLDISSVIDYDLQMCADRGADNSANNLLMATYDLIKWRCGRYDNDGTYGMTSSGNQNMNSVDDIHLGPNYGEQYSLLWSRFEKIFAAEYKTRGRELRKGVLSFANINKTLEGITSQIGAEAYADENIPYPTIPIGEEPRLQFRDWVRDRLAYFDRWLENLKEYVLCEGITLNKTALNFTSASSATLAAMLTPSNCNDDIVWTSSNPSVAYVTDGIVTAAADGSATITAMCGGHVATCEVTVTGVGSVSAPVYSLAAPLVIETADDIVDTGVKLFDENGSFTVALDVTAAFAEGIGGAYLGYKTSGYLTAGVEGYTQIVANAPLNDYLMQTWCFKGDFKPNEYLNAEFNLNPVANKRVALVVRYDHTTPHILKMSACDGEAIVNNTTEAHIPELFANTGSNIFVGGPAPGFDAEKMQYTKPATAKACTIHRCELYKRYLSDDEVAAFIGGMTT